MSDSNLSEFERRLSGWRPASDGLDADAMLFAAGRASVRSPARFAWPAIAACLALVVGLLGNRLVNERAENRQLLAQLQPNEAPARVVKRSLSLPETSLFAARRALERDPDGWSPPIAAAEGGDAPRAMLWVGQRDLEFER